MRKNRLPRRTLAALTAVFLLAAPTTAAHATAPPPPASAQGLRTFQQSYGLAPTGLVDTATAHLLRTAPDSELRAAFADPSDLGPEQLAHARTVIGVGKGADLPEQGQVIALMAAMQESKFVNYTTPVDHDSLGIFQQRPSMGWGTPKQITHVPTASKSFYGLPSPTDNPGLLQIKGWESMEPGKACQAVQRSAHPDRYAQWEGFARDLLEREGPTVDPID
ncbi:MULTISPECIES: peptidoglycan-binding protein [unclassified Streptomyces]|uniref:peptidoglycan-binding protein n=1 Tax=unclassified Streptomyces TaxID=2593676 RepID=UPI000B8855E6|nr:MULTISPECIES: peptidoglycan-binding protein [unclassified Streptomyces]MYR96410.1 peptidoglycan-binding protein [Streptomyces sp. SID4937]